MSKYTKPRNFNPSQEDLSRVGKEIAKNLSADKVVIAGNEKLRGSKSYHLQESEPMVLKPDPVLYNGKEISEYISILKDSEMIAIHLEDGSFEISEELLSLIHQVVESLDLKSIEELQGVSEKEFFNLFTPLMNEHYNLGQS